MKRAILTICLSVLLFLASPVMAVPVEVSFTDNLDGQDLIGPPISHELGIYFPTEELIAVTAETTNEIACQRDYTGGLNWLVIMTNQTGRSWENVMYVADPETTITNDDLKLVNGCLAFLIDKTGLNQPLIYESKTPDNIFEDGETWEFIVQEYTNSKGLAVLLFASYGAGNQSLGDSLSSGSIIAVPEPATIALLGLGALSLIRRKK